MPEKLEPATSGDFASAFQDGDALAVAHQSYSDWAAEYEGEVAFVGPEHPERQILDRFFDKLAEGDLSGAAEELQTLHAAGGSLSRPDVELVADLLDGSAVGTVSPYGLGFAKRGRGRPKHAVQSQLQAPWNAFASGDEVKASEALRKLDVLGGTDLETLAGLLSDDLAFHAHFAWRLVLQNPRQGKPKTRRTEARQFTTALIFTEARSRHKHMKVAIWEVSRRTGFNRAAIYKALKAVRDKSRIT